MISNDTIEEVKTRSNLVEVIQSFVNLKKKGADYVGLCPFHNEKSPSFTVSPSKQIFKCFGCGKSGDAIAFVMEHDNKTYPQAIEWLASKTNISIVEEQSKKVYVKPIERLEKLSKKALEFFEVHRKISNNTLLRFKISEANEWMPQFEAETTVICFNYFRDGELINIKFRGPKKSFKLAKDAQLIFYNLDAIKDQETVVIVEGEIDCLSLHESGVYNVISVPNGAGTGNIRLEYLDNCIDYFDKVKKVILMVDADGPGLNLREELARRLGIDRCHTVTYPEGCKDANDVLVKHGPAAVKKVVDQAKGYPIKGVITMDEMFDTVDNWYEKGYPKGAKTGIPGLDHLITFAPAQLTVITGIPGHGKDEVTNWIMASLVKNENWRWGILGFEETPPETVTKLAEKLSGKAFGFRKEVNDRMSRAEFERAISVIDSNFYIINPDEIETDIDRLLALFTRLVERYGINGMYINPWNWIDHLRPPGMTETEYVSMALGKLIKWSRRSKVHIFLLAHTTKIAKDKDGKYAIPTLYSVSGSANFFNKTHNGITVYRDYERNITDIYVQKIKQSWYGELGFATYQYNTMTRQYAYIGSEAAAQKIKIDPEAKKALGPGNWTPMTDLFDNQNAEAF